MTSRAVDRHRSDDRLGEDLGAGIARAWGGFNFASGWATAVSVRSFVPTTPGWIATWRSRSSSRPIPANGSWSDFFARPARWPGSTTPISWPFMTRALMTAGAGSPTSSSSVGRFGGIATIIGWIRCTAARIIAALADALDHAHHMGVVHRDLKPANVLIDDQGRPRLIDFGLARRFDLESDLTREGAVVGTPAYMSPEQAWPEPPGRRAERRLQPGRHLSRAAPWAPSR